jgi:hypothetical protein
MNEEDKSVEQRIADIERYINEPRPSATPTPDVITGGIVVEMHTYTLHLPLPVLGVVVASLLALLVIALLVARKFGRF